MLMGFMAEFVPSVIDGTKPHSFRENRKDGRKWKVGDTIQFYTGAYKKGQRIKFMPDGKVKYVYDVKMTIEEVEETEEKQFRLFLDGQDKNFLAVAIISRNDGFNTPLHFTKYFFPKLDVGVWEGQLVIWTDLKY